MRKPHPSVQCRKRASAVTRSYFSTAGWHGRHGLQEDRDGAAVVIGEPGGVADDLGHLAADEVEIRRLPVLQQRRRCRPRSNCRCRSCRSGVMFGAFLPPEPARAAGQEPAGSGRAEPGPRRVAIAATRRPSRRDRRRGSTRHPWPGRAATPGRASASAMAAAARARPISAIESGPGRAAAHRRQAVEKRLQIGEIAVAQPGIVRERKDRQIMRCRPARCPSAARGRNRRGSSRRCRSPGRG